jgi:hypothetical protein
VSNSVPFIQSGLDANKPSTSAIAVGSLYITTDTKLIYQNTGSTWDVRGGRINTVLNEGGVPVLLGGADASKPVASTNNAGWVYFASDTKCIYQSTGSTWDLRGGVGWTLSGNNLYFNLAGNLGIGTETPSAKLDVVGDTNIKGDLIIGNGTAQNVLKLYNMQLDSNLASRIEFRLADGQHVQIRHNSHDAIRSPFGLHIEKTADNTQPSFKAYLEVEGDIYANGGNKVWHAGNDGSGSGLDADLIDGKHADNLMWKAVHGTITDFDAALTAGLYVFTNTAVNGPESSCYGVCRIYVSNGETHNNSNNWIWQFWYSTSGGYYFRYKVNSGAWTGWRKPILNTGTTKTNGFFYDGTTAPSGTTRLNYDGYFYATRVYNAVFNDYAEYFEKDTSEEFEPGDVICKSSDNTYCKSKSPYDRNVVGVYSDSFGHILGGNGDGNDDENFIPVGLAGRITVKAIGYIEQGDLLVSSHIPGVAMSYSGNYIPGTVIGKALESYSSADIGKIKMLIMNC